MINIEKLSNMILDLKKLEIYIDEYPYDDEALLKYNTIYRDILIFLKENL